MPSRVDESRDAPARAVLFAHSEPVTAGRLAPVLEEAGYSLVHRLREVRPGDEDAELVVVLGGFMGMYELEEHPYLREELRLVEARLARGAPTLGICLGAQLLAQACGSKVERDPSGMVIGAERIQLNLPPGWSGVPDTLDVPSWHGDTFAPIPGAQSLGRSRHHPQEMFQVGASIGILFHPEAEVRTFESWAASSAPSLARAGRTLGELKVDDFPRLEEAAAATRRLLENVARSLAAYTPKRG